MRISVRVKYIRQTRILVASITNSGTAIGVRVA
jgi:hypothetical protein